MPKTTDLSGRTFHSLFVLRRGENGKRGRVQWWCRCKCGKDVLVLGDHLKSGNTGGCGCTRAVNLMGLRFNRLLVLHKAPKKQFPLLHWACICDCGKQAFVTGSQLRSGNTGSCGCLRTETVALVGRQFDRLHVIARGANDTRRNVRWVCVCVCGTETRVTTNALLKGKSRSCGCLRLDAVKTHGQSYSPEYRMFVSAKHRAKKAGIAFNLELSDIIIPSICPYLGVALLVASGCRRPGPNSPSLDRIDPCGGYVRGNVEVISHRANAIKQNTSFDEFELFYTNWKRRLEV